jgi:hypothetical protein
MDLKRHVPLGLILLGAAAGIYLVWQELASQA